MCPGAAEEAKPGGKGVSPAQPAGARQVERSLGRLSGPLTAALGQGRDTLGRVPFPSPWGSWPRLSLPFGLSPECGLRTQPSTRPGSKRCPVGLPQGQQPDTKSQAETLPGPSFLGDRLSTYLVWCREPLLTGCDHGPRAQDEPLAEWPSLVTRRALEARLVLSGQQAVPSSPGRWHRTLWARSTKPPPWGHRSCFPEGLKVFTPREPRGSW